MKRPSYVFYATLLDSFQSWLSSSETWQEYWGFAEDPSKSEEDFEKEQFQSLIDRINRVPMKWEDSEAADRGTVFNEIVDCVIENRNSKRAELKSNKETGLITANYNKRTFVFPISLIRELADYFKGAMTQVYTEGKLPTKYGIVLLYGFMDELMPDSVHDIKTTSKYKVGKFRKNWQHIVYPYCLRAEGNNIYDFEYNVVNLSNNSTYKEFYKFNPDVDVPRLTNHVEQLIEFIETNKQLITDQKVFNSHQDLYAK